MTLKEAKKILEKEGFYVEKATRPCAISESFIEYEDPTICEAMQVISSAGYFIYMEMGCFDERKARLKKELEEHSNAPVSGKEKAKEGNPALEEAASQFNDALLDEQSKKIDEQNREITRLLSLVEKKENSISRLYYEKSVLEKENEDLKKGEIPARYFDKALVDEQEEKIKKLEHEKLDILEMASSCKQTIAEQGKKINRLGKEISRLNGIIHDKNEEIKRKTKGCCELVAENVDLKEDLRNTESLLHDTREANSRNLDTCFKNEDLIDELKKKLTEKTKLAKKYAKELSDSSLGLCKLEKQLKDKNAVLSDVAEELRLTKIREKNLAELGLKYVGENEKLKKELANKVVDKIDAQALKSAESALAYKDEVIETLNKELAEAKHELSSLKRPFRPDSTEAVVLFTDAYAKAVKKHLPCIEWKNDGKEVSVTYILENGKKSKIALDFTGDEIIFSRTDPDKPRKDSLYSYKDKQLAEKDDVIADLGNELAATKKELEDANKLVNTVRKYSKAYREYGIEAVKMIRKMAKVIVNEGPVSSKDFKEYRRLANGYRFNPQLPDFSEEEEKKLTAKILDINAKCMRAARESINDVFESYAAKYVRSTLDDLKEKAYESFNAKACNLGLVGSKDGNGIIDQMIGVDIAEEGGDHSGIIAQCCKNIAISKDEAEIIERCTKNGTELHYSEKDGFTYTNMFGDEMPIICLRGMCQVFTDEEIKNMKK